MKSLKFLTMTDVPSNYVQFSFGAVFSQGTNCFLFCLLKFYIKMLQKCDVN